MSSPVRFGYVGCGFVAQTIDIPNFRSLPDCDFLALAEARPELGKRVALRYNILRIYISHEELAADPDIEAVGVSAPYALQGRIAEDLIRAGKHVFMEKPMAVTVKRAESLASEGRPFRRGISLPRRIFVRWDGYLSLWRLTHESNSCSSVWRPGRDAARRHP